MFTEKRSIQYQVLKTFFLLRENGDCSIAELSRILSKNFRLRMPITPYREFPSNQMEQDRRVIRGMRAYIKDMKSLKKLKSGKTTLSTFLRGLKNKPNDKSSRRNHWVEISYVLKQEDLIFNGNKVMGSWTTLIRSTVDPEISCQLQGMLQCEFNELYRIVFLDLYFDVNPIVLVLEAIINMERSAMTPSGNDSTNQPIQGITSAPNLQIQQLATAKQEEASIFKQICSSHPKPIIVSSLNEINSLSVDKYLGLYPLGEYNGVHHFVGTLAPTSSQAHQGATVYFLKKDESSSQEGLVLEEQKSYKEQIDMKANLSSTPESGSDDWSEEFQMPKSSDSEADTNNDEQESISSTTMDNTQNTDGSDDQPEAEDHN
mmetsp:Transcript_32400/g.41505  ORF Transcript_32400/g.41505 Transcript_32400/m.41505 type:complete len:374 (-) Transcript_32400:224-1345(-)